MSAAWWTDFVCALAVLVTAWNLHMQLGTIKRQHRQIAALTRRVWKLEGSPRGSDE